SFLPRAVLEGAPPPDARLCASECAAIAGRLARRLESNPHLTCPSVKATLLRRCPARMGLDGAAAWALSRGRGPAPAGSHRDADCLPCSVLNQPANGAAPRAPAPRVVCASPPEPPRQAGGGGSSAGWRAITGFASPRTMVAACSGLDPAFAFVDSSL